MTKNDMVHKVIDAIEDRGNGPASSAEIAIETVIDHIVDSIIPGLASTGSMTIGAGWNSCRAETIRRLKEFRG